MYCKGFEEEEYAYSGSIERGCRWKFPVKDMRKVASEPWTEQDIESLIRFHRSSRR
jgi:hypothetical protein